MLLTWLGWRRKKIPAEDAAVQHAVAGLHAT
jgi:hypothetical protein